MIVKYDTTLIELWSLGTALAAKLPDGGNNLPQNGCRHPPPPGSGESLAWHRGHKRQFAVFPLPPLLPGAAVRELQVAGFSGQIHNKKAVS